MPIGWLRQHAVIGGDGPPLLLVHGWPQNWYAWRLVMPALARDFEVIAPDQRGIGLTDKPKDGYDPGTIADDLVALMDALGHKRFALVGTDTGLPIAYALTADHPGPPPGRADRLAIRSPTVNPRVSPWTPVLDCCGASRSCCFPGLPCSAVVVPSARAGADDRHGDWAEDQTARAR